MSFSEWRTISWTFT